MAKGKKTGGGNRKGKPNRATADVRKAIATVLETNAANFSKWLERVAEGEKEFEAEKDEEGNDVIDPSTGDPKGEWSWLRRPEPGTALKLAMDMAEYHIPKLARMEHTDGDGKPLPMVQVTFVKK
jgi:hypothetical protein